MRLKPKRKAKLFKFFRFTRLPYLPFVLGIETGNFCNLRCPLCPTGAGDPAMKKGFIEFALFKKILDELKEPLSSINLYSWGEPLLNKDLVKIVSYGKSVKKGLKIITSTNLNIKDREVLGDLIVSGIDEIIVSCDGASQETYSKYRVGGDFQLLMDNLKYLVKIKKELKKDTLIIWNFLVFRHNEHEIETAKKMARDLGVVFRLGLMRTSMKEEILRPHRESVSKDMDWIPDNPEYSAYDKEKFTPKKIIKTCIKPWQEISVNWDGKIFPCCAVYGDEYNLGDVKRDSIVAIWNSDLYIEGRREILNKKRIARTICGICRNNGFMHM